MLKKLATLGLILVAAATVHSVCYVHKNVDCIENWENKVCYCTEFGIGGTITNPGILDDARDFDSQLDMRCAGNEELIPNGSNCSYECSYVDAFGFIDYCWLNGEWSPTPVGPWDYFPTRTHRSIDYTSPACGDGCGTSG